MGKHIPSDYDWSWWPGDPDGAPPSRLEDVEEPETVAASAPMRVVPADPPFFDDAPAAKRPLARSRRYRRAERQRRLARIAAPLLLLGLVAALVVVIRLPDASAAQPTIAQSDEIQAYIVGAVAHPGVYVLRSGDRVYKLIAAAGGLTKDADLARINQAAYVADGEEVFVPRVGQSFPSGLADGGPGKVNINTATAEDMDALLPISLTTAKKIVDYRDAHGPYTTITQLLNVMSRTTFDKIKDFITV